MPTEDCGGRCPVLPSANRPIWGFQPDGVRPARSENERVVRIGDASGDVGTGRRVGSAPGRPPLTRGHDHVGNCGALAITPIRRRLEARMLDAVTAYAARPRSYSAQEHVEFHTAIQSHSSKRTTRSCQRPP